MRGASASIEAVHDSAENRVRKWRIITLLAGTLLASCFFMPGIQGCGTPVVPVRRVYESLQDIEVLEEIVRYQPLTAYGPAFGAYVAAYLFGAVMAVSAAARLAGSAGWQRVGRIGLTAVAIAVCLLLLVFAVDVWLRYDLSASLFFFSLRGQISLVIFVYCPIVLLAWLMGTVRLRDRAFLSRAFMCSVLSLVWFAYWFGRGLSEGRAIYYGLYLSSTASFLLVVGTLCEAAILTGQPWPRALWQLLTCRLSEFSASRGHCRGCGYYLYGLTQMRCPECGRPFTFEETGTTASDIAFGRNDASPTHRGANGE